MTTIQPRVFISHSSADKPFVRDLAVELRSHGLDVWYDDWEIAVGDSIIDKIFEGLRASDTLVVVLSPVSVASRWVKEELNTVVMRRVSENDIRILPVLLETCDIPLPLRHIRYADFRQNKNDGFALLLDSLAPNHLLWQPLSHMYDHLCLLCDQVADSDLNSDVRDKITKIHSLLEAALNLRTAMEFRRAHQKMSDMNFFEKVEFLADRGVDVRSQTWNALVYFRASLAHSMAIDVVTVSDLVKLIESRYGSEGHRKMLLKMMERLKEIMHRICFEHWEYEKM